MNISESKPLFPLSVVARLTNVPLKVLNYFEKQGLTHPAKTPGNRRLYSKEDLKRVFTVKYLKEKAKLNSNGIKLILEIIEYADKKGVDLKGKFFKDLKEEQELELALSK